MGDVFSDIKSGLLGPLQAKADKLETAIKLIVALSGVAALTGVYTAFVKR